MSAFFLVVLTFHLSLQATHSFAQSASVKTRVILDRDTFPLSSYGAMQAMVDKVALIVDQLIPGQAISYPNGGILCFIAPERWNGDPSVPSPITLVGPSRPGEPPSAHPHPVRIALNRKVLRDLPKFEPELA